MTAGFSRSPLTFGWSGKPPSGSAQPDIPWSGGPGQTAPDTTPAPNPPPQINFSGMMAGLFGAGNGRGGSAATVPPVDTSAATAAAYSTAKNQIGQSMQGLIKAARGNAEARGIGGSGIETRNINDTIMGGASKLSDVSTALAEKNAELANSQAQTNYQGAITQRGQDLEAQRARTASILGLWKAFGGGNDMRLY